MGYCVKIKCEDMIPEEGYVPMIVMFSLSSAPKGVDHRLKRTGFSLDIVVRYFGNSHGKFTDIHDL